MMKVTTKALASTTTTLTYDYASDSVSGTVTKITKTVITDMTITAIIITKIIASATDTVKTKDSTSPTYKRNAISKSINEVNYKDEADIFISVEVGEEI